MTRRPFLVVLALLALALAVPVTTGEIGLGGVLGSASPTLPRSAVGDLGSPSPGASGDDLETPAPSPSPAPDGPVSDVAIVPVAPFRSTATASSRKDVAAILAGTSPKYDSLELVKSQSGPILAALGLDAPTVAGRLILASDAGKLARDLAKHPQRLGFLRADAVGPDVRALTWGGRSLFGVARLVHTGDWKLTARLPAAPAGEAFDASTTWTLFAGGDIMLDRGVYQTLEVKGKGADFMFDGGTADITGHTCCSAFGWPLPSTRRVGAGGTVRALISGADIAMANFENPAPNKFRWHQSGTIFSADPMLISGIKDAGIDYVSLANNHIRDQGGNGLLQTITNLQKRGIKSSGAGVNLAAARKPAMFTTHGVKVAILAYDAIAAYYHATATKVGSAPLSPAVVKADVRAARAAGAKIVIVFPHWGREYQNKPFAGQQSIAHSIIDAGADMVIGNHAHYAAAMEVYEGKPIWYALGNLVFDQTWSEPTMEGITLELTFRGSELVQARIRPHIILDKAQPNFMDPAGDGRVVMGQIWDGSKGLLPW